MSASNDDKRIESKSNDSEMIKSVNRRIDANERICICERKGLFMDANVQCLNQSIIVRSLAFRVFGVWCLVCEFIANT